MVIDTRKCIGCDACNIGCVAENKLPPGVVYRPVKEEESGSYPKVTRRFLPHLCNHCENPPCVPVCPVTPVKATNQRPDGIVDINYDTCIGCGLCVGACPYGARTLDKGDLYTAKTPKSEAYEKLANFEYGHRWGRDSSKPPVGKARKCHFGTLGLDAAYEPYQVNIDSMMRGKGYRQPKDCVTLKFAGADHNERAWREGLHFPILFLLGAHR